MQNIEDLKYLLALTITPNIGPVTAKTLLQNFSSAKEIYNSSYKSLMQIEGLGDIRAKSIKSFSDFSNIEKEIDYAQKHNIEIISILNENYPNRLKSCIDAPTVLFYKGNANLNASKIISVVGTRRNTDYGNELCKQLIKHFQNNKEVLIVSGLATGIDTLAHKYSLQNNVSTAGVMAHGFNTLYPSQNKTMANQMIENGGLITEYFHNIKPDKENFPTRNRIVAGMADVVVIIETEIKGGSMITANLADSYNKDIATFPGKIFDTKSAGCNYLIKTNKANLINSPRDLCELMNWEEKEHTQKAMQFQKQLFVELSPNEKIVFDLINQQKDIHIDTLLIKCGLSSSQLAAALLTLEMQNIIITLPGKIYKMA